MNFFCPQCGAHYAIHPKEIFHQVIDGNKRYELWCLYCFEGNDGRRDEPYRLLRLSYDKAGAVTIIPTVDSRNT
jgi:hypothetical protein